MDGLTQLFSSVGGFMGGGGDTPNWMKLLTGAQYGMGTIGNILEQRKRAQYQNMIMSLLSHPERLAAMAAKIQQPLSAALTQSVGNTVQANMASRGLSQAPGIFAATESQALAPYEQQNQQIAMNAVLQALGMPAGTFQAPSNNSGALQMFLNQFKKPGPAPTWSGGSVGGFYDPALGSISAIPVGPPDVNFPAGTPPTFPSSSSTPTLDPSSWLMDTPSV